MIEKIKIFLKENFSNFVVLITLFFFISYLVVVLRIQKNETYIMPEVTGKNILQVYNLIQKYDLRLELQKIYIAEKPNGIIIQQNILPGEVIKPKDKLVLIINDYEPVLVMPKLVGLTIENAKKILEAIPYEDKIYSLNITRIIYIHKKDIPPNVVLNQFPAENTKVPLNEKIILIVSSDHSESIENLKDLEIGPLSNYFMHQNQMYFISETIPTKDNALNGKVKEIKKNKNDFYYEISVYYNKSKKYSFYSDYERGNFKIKLNQKCEVYASNKETEDIKEIKKEQKIWFSTENVFPDRKIEILFYRTGLMYIYLLCNDKLIDKEKYSPDYNI
ncbi:MAG: PASTA domain-containing protein [Leptonema sp. (in: bacteria)]